MWGNPEILMEGKKNTGGGIVLECSGQETLSLTMLENMVIKIKIVLFPPKVTKFCEEIKQLATEWDWTKYKDLF